MNTTPAQAASKQRMQHILSTLWRYKILLIAPAVIGMVLSAFYVVALRPQSWSAKQSLIVRDDLLGQSFKPGRFDSMESMKSAQETILEIARKPQVIRNALEQLGPESTGLFGLGAGEWPTEETIETVQGSITFNAPNGAEFGKTEVIVLNTKASTRERSRQFIELLLNEIIVKVDEVRSLRLQSMEAELTQARDSAMLALDESKAKLQKMYENLGSDFDSMTSLDDSQSSANTIKRDISQIRMEQRQTEVELEKRKILLTQLIAAQEDPQRILSISGDLIAVLPALDVLKKALIEKQGELAEIVGQYEKAHPSFLNAENSIEAMKQQMYLELKPSIAGLENEISLTKNRLQRLGLEMESLDERLVSLGSKRANNVTLESDLKNRSEIANKLQSDLSEIQGLAHSINAELITRVDEPQVSTRPDGLSKKATVLAVGLGGLMLGLGLVILIAPPIEDEQASTPRREGDAERTKAQTVESFFDSKSFEKIIVSAATAASMATQSATKARQYFMPQKPEQGDSGVGSLDAQTTADQEPVESKLTASTAAVNSTVEPTTPNVPPPTPQPTRQSPREMPSVNDLLEAANEIAIPAPVASMPLSSSNRKIEIRPVDSPPTAANPKSANPSTKAPVSANQNLEIPEFANPIQANRVPASVMALTEPAAKPASELAAIQLAALRGTQVSPSAIAQTPTPKSESPLPKPLKNEPLKTGPLKNEPSKTEPSKTEPSKTEPLKTEPLKTGPLKTGPLKTGPLKTGPSAGEIKSETSPALAKRPVPIRDEPQTIVVSDMPERAATQANLEAPDNEPVANLTRRSPNMRPVDLAKSATDDDSTFVRINPSKNNSEAKEESSDSDESDNAKSPQPRSPNPFLKDRAPTPVPERQDFGDKDDPSSVGIPDQIQKLSDSIAKFANPASHENQDS